MATKSSSFRQDRRQWLKMSATAIGATLLPSATVQAEVETASSAPKPRDAKDVTHFFTRHQYHLIEELTETVIPADNRSGGAKAAKVADYIELVVGQSVNDEQKALWAEGLRLVDLMSQHRTGKPYIESTPEERTSVLTILSENDEMTDLPETRFFHELKRLTARGYYTSKIGIHDELQYKGNKALLDYVGCGDHPS